MFYFEQHRKSLENLIQKRILVFFLVNSSISKAYRVFNKRTLVIEESMHVVFDEYCNNISNESICNDDLERNFGDLL